MMHRQLMAIWAGIASAQQFYKLDTNRILPRSDGYHPEFGGCSAGVDCEDACGTGYKSCGADTELALFCFSPSKGQECCNDGTGKACDDGFRCRRGGGQTWCCPDGMTDKDCDALAPTKNPDEKPSSTSTGNADGPDTVTVTEFTTTITQVTTTTTVETVWTTVVRTEGAAGGEATVTESCWTTRDVTLTISDVVTTTVAGGYPPETLTTTTTAKCAGSCDGDGSGDTATKTCTTLSTVTAPPVQVTPTASVTGPATTTPLPSVVVTAHGMRRLDGAAATAVLGALVAGWAVLVMM